MIRNRFFRGFRTLCMAALALSCAGFAASAQSRDKVVVASKIDTEGALLGHMVLIALEKAGVPVENRLQLGPTKIVRTALVSGEIDLYPEYTGNGAFFFNKEDDPAWKQAQSGYDLVKRLDEATNKLVWLDRAPANNTWLIAVRGDLARRERLATMDDFAQVAKRGGSSSSPARPSSWRARRPCRPSRRAMASRCLGIRSSCCPGGDTAVTMRAAAQQLSGVNSAMVYGTDGAISALDLVVMEDTKGAQIVYEPAPVVRAAVLEKYPVIRQTLGRVFATLSLNQLQVLNAQISVEGQQPRAVAMKYLQQKGLVR